MIEPCKIDLSMLEGEEREKISTRIQEVCFTNGIVDNNGEQVVAATGKPWILIYDGCVYRNYSLNVDHLSEISYQEFLAKYEQKPTIESFKCDLSNREDRNKIAAKTAEYLGKPVRWINTIDTMLSYHGGKIEGWMAISFDEMPSNNPITVDQLLEMIGCEDEPGAVLIEMKNINATLSAPIEWVEIDGDVEAVANAAMAEADFRPDSPQERAYAAKITASLTEPTKQHEPFELKERPYGKPISPMGLWD